MESLALKFLPLTSKKWNDLVELFGKNGACGGCWCMYPRVERKIYLKQKGTGNKNNFKRIVSSGRFTGILAYYKNKPIAWCSFEPRENFPILKKSRILKPVDENPVWSIVCFFVKKEFRRKYITVQLLNAAKKYAKKFGAKILEGYPVETKKKWADPFVWIGLASAFSKAGFKEVARRSETRPIMRFYF